MPAIRDRCCTGLWCGVMLLGALVSAGCAEPPSERPEAVPVRFVVDRPFEGEFTVHNQPGAASPVAGADGGLVIAVDSASARSVYDFSRWPAVFKSTGAFRDGTPIEMLVRIDSAEYAMQVVGWDDDKNMILRMTPKRR